MKVPLVHANSYPLDSPILSGTPELSLLQHCHGTDARLVKLVRLLARQAARDYVNVLTKEHQEGPP
jgi:hypothetical protein